MSKQKKFNKNRSKIFYLFASLCAFAFFAPSAFGEVDSIEQGEISINQPVTHFTYQLKPSHPLCPYYFDKFNRKLLLQQIKPMHALTSIRASTHSGDIVFEEDALKINYKKQISLDALLPLYEHSMFFLFSQIGYRAEQEQDHLSLWFGGRSTLVEENAGIGVNGGINYDVTHQLKQFGVGAELRFNYVNFTINGYFKNQASAGKKSMAMLPASVDALFQAYLPILPQLGIKAGYQHDLSNTIQERGAEKGLLSDPWSATFGLNYTPIPLLTFGLEYQKQKDHDDGLLAGTLSINYRFGLTAQEQLYPEAVNTLRRFSISRYDFITHYANKSSAPAL